MFGKIKQYIYNKTKFGRTRYLNYLYQYDLKQYFDNSLMGIGEEKKLATQIRLLAHAIEKGFSLSEPKPGFGKKKIIELIDLYEKYKLYKNPEDDQIKDVVFATLNAYIQFQKSNNVDISFIPEQYQQYLAGEVSWLDISLYYYYQNAEGIMHSKWSERRLDVYDAYEERVDFFKVENEQNYYKRELRRLFMAYYGFFVDVIKQPKEESKYARRKTKERLIKSLKKYKSELEQTFTKYDIFSIFCLFYGGFSVQKWIVNNEFEPIQNILRRLKQIGMKDCESDS